jgi:hypothetical protein
MGIRHFVGQTATFDTAATFRPVLRASQFARARLCLPDALPFDSAADVDEVFAMIACHFALLDVPTLTVGVTWFVKCYSPPCPVCDVDSLRPSVESHHFIDVLVSLLNICEPADRPLIFQALGILTAASDWFSEELVSRPFIEQCYQLFNLNFCHREIVACLANVSAASADQRDKVLSFFPLPFLAECFRVPEQELHSEMSRLFMNIARFPLRDDTDTRLIIRVFCVVIKKRLVSERIMVLWGLHYALNCLSQINERLLPSRLLECMFPVVDDREIAVVCVLVRDFVRLELSIVGTLDCDWVVGLLGSDDQNVVKSALLCMHEMLIGTPGFDCGVGLFESLLDNCHFLIRLEVGRILWALIEKRGVDFAESLLGNQLFFSCLSKLVESDEPQLIAIVARMLCALYEAAAAKEALSQFMLDIDSWGIVPALDEMQVEPPPELVTFLEVAFPS